LSKADLQQPSLVGCRRAGGRVVAVRRWLDANGSSMSRCSDRRAVGVIADIRMGDGSADEQNGRGQRKRKKETKGNRHDRSLMQQQRMKGHFMQLNLVPSVCSMLVIVLIVSETSSFAAKQICSRTARSLRVVGVGHAAEWMTCGWLLLRVCACCFCRRVAAWSRRADGVRWRQRPSIRPPGALRRQRHQTNSATTNTSRTLLHCTTRMDCVWAGHALRAGCTD